MAKGIFNPYQEKKPKKKFRSSIDPDNPYDSEAHREPPKGSIKLDGDSHVLEFDDIEIDQIPERLGILIKDVIAEYRAILVRHGIDLLPLEGTRELEQGEVSLPTPSGHLCLFVNESSTENKVKMEVEIFRRIAHALLEVPRELLIKHNARILVRG